VRALCKYFKISRNGYYKGQGKEIEQAMVEQLVVNMVVQERHVQPRLGGRKLYHMYAEQIHGVCPRLGRDKFVGLLRAEGLLLPALPQLQHTPEVAVSITAGSTLGAAVELDYAIATTAPICVAPVVWG
jgi:hypothetical protein